MGKLLACCGLVLVAACSPVEDATYAPDLLDHHVWPAAADDWSVAPFSDQGAWFGFGLPPVDRPGGFSGPFLMSRGSWLGPRFVNLEIDGAPPAEVRSTGWPGHLRQDYAAAGLDVRQTLFFATPQTALILVRMHNPRAEALTAKLAVNGNLFGDEVGLVTTPRGVMARLPGGDGVRVDVDRPTAPAAIEGTTYRLALADAVTVDPGETAYLTLAVTMTIGGEPGCPDELLARPAAAFAANRERWSRYLAAIDTGRDLADPVQVLAAKSLLTLVNNWRAPAGRLEHDGLFPSSNVWYFNGFWAWDSWKHAVGLARFDGRLAGEQIRLMFDHQDDLGMIADVVYLDPAEDNWRDTKPPLAGWALEEVYARTGDLELVRDLYPGLVDYHRFWYDHRDHDRDGLCEYGSTDGTLVAARWESGMDNAVRFDHTQMLQNGPRAWSMDQESVDLNSYLYREKLALGTLADALGRPDDATRWRAEADTLGRRIRTAMFDEATGWFHDIALDGSAIIPVQGPEGWTPLWSGVATAEQAAAVRTAMLDTTRFRTHVPFPTVSRAHPEFSEGYWRGLVWLDQVYFAVEGLRRYGYDADAEALTAQVFANLEGATTPGVPLRENYHPLTGEGRNVKHFSWTAAHLLLLALDSP